MVSTITQHNWSKNSDDRPHHTRAHTHTPVLWPSSRTTQVSQYTHTHTHTHTHTDSRLTALFPGLHRSVGTRTVKPIWILLKQQTVSGSGIRWAICKSAPRPRQMTTPAPHHSVFYRPDALPVAQPTASKHWRQFKALKASQYQKGKTNLDFTEARDSRWLWHQLGHMQVCTSLQTDNHASTPPLSFFMGRMPFMSPKQHRQSTEGTSTEGPKNNCPSPKGSGPHLIHGSLGPPESISQTASWSVEIILAQLVIILNRQTHRQITLHLQQYAASSHSMHAMRPNNTHTQPVLL